MSPMILIVGEAPGRGGLGPDGPLGGRCGDRLASLLQLPRALWDVSGEVSAVNLLDAWPGWSGAGPGKGSRFPIGLAKMKARELVAGLTPDHVVLLLGKRVAAAARVRTAYFEWGSLGPSRCAVVPHPSGISHWWNEKANVERAASFFADLRGQAPSRSSVPSQTNSPSTPMGR